MIEWTIVVPVWGERCIGSFLNVGLPAIKAALAHSGSRARFEIYANEPWNLMDGLRSLNARIHAVANIHAVPDGINMHRVLGRCHRNAISAAKHGSVLAFINADNVPSIEAFAACERRIAEGKKLIVCAGTRTWPQSRPPIAATSRELLRWAWENRHPWISDCIWGRGRAAQPATVHFVAGDNVVTHGFHLHPFAMVIDGRSTDFKGATIDDDMPSRFRPEEIHVVTDADEMALAEVSPQMIPRLFSRAEVLGVTSVQAWANEKWASGLPRVNDMHKWFFQHGIRIAGDGDAGDAEPCAAILAAL